MCDKNKSIEFLNPIHSVKEYNETNLYFEFVFIFVGLILSYISAKKEGYLHKNQKNNTFAPSKKIE
ncbi:hypothetical protein FACS189434_04670 [Bacteroidia bacterium]|nr:hypothetical protein FACS189434_04670 [Bacteroidia bacterium]